MKLEVAYAVYKNSFYPMYASNEGGKTALLRLATVVEKADGSGTFELTDFATGTDTEAWADEAQKTLVALGGVPKDEHSIVEPRDHIIDTAGGTTLPAGSELSGSPWYAVFWIRDPETKNLELWVGRFMADSEGVGYTPEPGGVYGFKPRQAITMADDGVTPIRVPLRAERSVLYPSIDSVDDPTSKAKEQGCSFDQADLTVIAPWPTNE